MGKKKNRFQKAIDRIFFELTRSESKELYKQEIKQLKKDGIEITDEMRKQIRRECVKECSEEAKRKAKRRGLIVGIFGLGALTGVGGTLALNPAVEGVKNNKSKNQIEINLDEIENPIVFTGSTEKTKSFREEIADSVISQDARKKAKDQVYNAKEPEEVLNIVKKRCS